MFFYRVKLGINGKDRSLYHAVANLERYWKLNIQHNVNKSYKKG